MYYIIANPNAGNKKCKKKLKKITRYLDANKIEYSLYQTAKAGDAVGFARELTAVKEDGGLTKLIAMGGDGTFNEVLNGIDSFEHTELGLIPCGTGNDFAKSMNLKLKPLEALKQILNGNADYCDFIETDEARALNEASSGIVTDVLKRYQKAKIKGKFQYFKSLLTTLMKMHYQPFKVTADGADITDGYEECLLLSVCNGKSFGGGITVSPFSCVNDGLLDVIIIKKPTVWLLKAVMKFKKGKHLKYDFVKHIRAKNVEVLSPEAISVETDGEIHDDFSFNAKVAAEKLKIYA
jgi:YegS/Rv2252/BmrU family lipid kinase